MKLSIAILATAVAGASAISLSDIPKCAASCVMAGGLPSECGLDPKCICSAESFIDDMSCCVLKSCTDKSDQDKLMAFASKLCKSFGVEVPTEIVCKKDEAKTTTSEKKAESTTSEKKAESTTSEKKAEPTTSEKAEPTTSAETTSAVETSAAATSHASTEAATSAAATSKPAEATSAPAASESSAAVESSKAAEATKATVNPSMTSVVASASSDVAISGGHATTAPIEPSLNGAVVKGANAGAMALVAAAMLM